MEEYSHAKRSLKVGKSAGPDNIAPWSPENMWSGRYQIYIILSSCNHTGTYERYQTVSVVAIKHPSCTNIGKFVKHRQLRGYRLNLHHRKDLQQDDTQSYTSGPIDSHLRADNQNGFRKKLINVKLYPGHESLILGEAQKTTCLSCLYTIIDFKKAFDSIYWGK